MNLSVARWAEDLIAHYVVKSKGCILVRNYRVRGSEIDILACRGPKLYVIEVKYRRHRLMHAEQIRNLMSFQKCSALQRGCEAYLRGRPHLCFETVRIDLAFVSSKSGAKDARIQYFPNVYEV